MAPQEVTLTIRTEGLAALADLALATKDQSKLDELLAKNSEGKLLSAEMVELDTLLLKIDELNLVKARAAATLHELMSKE
ncbi:MAG: hypothetical protein ACKO85_08805 [Isosphaeraceae bacterium]